MKRLEREEGCMIIVWFLRLYTVSSDIPLSWVPSYITSSSFGPSQTNLKPLVQRNKGCYGNLVTPRCCSFLKLSFKKVVYLWENGVNCVYSAFKFSKCYFQQLKKISFKYPYYYHCKKNNCHDNFTTCF